MRPRPLTLAATIAGLLGASLIAAPAANADAAQVDDVCIPSVPETDRLDPGPVDICVTVFRPAGASADAPVPVLLNSHGWGGSRTTSADSFQRYLDAGFGVVSIDQRGFGESGGKAHIEDPAFEGEDVIRVIDHVASLDWVKKTAPGDPVLGATGGSYGGGYQFVGAFTEIMKTGRTRFDALAPQITWHSLNESLAPQDVARTAWGTLLYAAGANAHTSTMHAGFAESLATGNWPASVKDFLRDNGPAFHVAAGRRLDIPVLLHQGISDNLFPLDQAIKNFDEALTARARADSLFIGFNGGHTLPSAVPPGYATAGDACPDRLGGADIASYEDVELAFLEENLLGAERTLTGHGRYNLMTAEGDCVSVDSVAPADSFPLRDISTTTGVGLPQAVKIAEGPLTVAGSPRLRAKVSTLGLEGRAFFALSVGTSPLDAKVIQNNLLPHRETGSASGEARTIELPSVAAEIPEGRSLFLTVTPVSDMYLLHGSRLPNGMVLRDPVVQVPLAGRPAA